MANRTGQPSLMGCSLSSRRDSPRLGVVDVLLTTCRGTPQFMARCLDSVWICGVQLAKNGKIWQVKTCFWTLWMDLGVLHFESVSKNASGCLVHVPCIFQKIPGWKVSAGYQDVRVAMCWGHSTTKIATTSRLFWVQKRLVSGAGSVLGKQDAWHDVGLQVQGIRCWVTCLYTSKPVGFSAWPPAFVADCNLPQAREWLAVLQLV